MTEDNRPDRLADPLAGEAPEADAVEQRLAAGAEGNGQEWLDEVPFDADEADAAEQERVVELDEDDYR